MKARNLKHSSMRMRVPPNPPPLQRMRIPLSRVQNPSTVACPCPHSKTASARCAPARSAPCSLPPPTPTPSPSAAGGRTVSTAVAANQSPRETFFPPAALQPFTRNRTAFGGGTWKRIGQKEKKKRKRKKKTKKKTTAAQRPKKPEGKRRGRHQPAAARSPASSAYSAREPRRGRGRLPTVLGGRGPFAFAYRTGGAVRLRL